MTKITAWLKHNWLTTGLVLVIIYLLVSQDLPHPKSSPLSQIAVTKSFSDTAMMAMPVAGGGMNTRESAPDRLVVTETSLSLVVKAVDQTISQIQTLATQYGGFLVNSNLSQPESAASGQITIRVPATKKDEALLAIKQLGTKVVSEYVSGRDVTDRYQDLDTRLASLNQTKLKFEAILAQATRVSDIMEITREITNLQDQIDSIKGQQQYLSQTTELAKITINLSTDELALPYTPQNSWEPVAIAKQAIRSLVTTLRSLGTGLIWLVIYSPLIIIVLIGRAIYRRRQISKSKGKL